MVLDNDQTWNGVCLKEWRNNHCASSFLRLLKETTVSARDRNLQIHWLIKSSDRVQGDQTAGKCHDKSQKGNLLTGRIHNSFCKLPKSLHDPGAMHREDGL